MSFLNYILSETPFNVKKLIFETLQEKVSKKLVEVKKDVAKSLSETNILRQGNTHIIRRRIRKGKIQRNVRMSSIKGYIVRGGKLRKIPQATLLKMKLSQRRASRIRRAKMSNILRKRQIAHRKRKAIGLKENNVLSTN